jgi:hypothetical protein
MIVSYEILCFINIKRNIMDISGLCAGMGRDIAVVSGY